MADKIDFPTPASLGCHTKPVVLPSSPTLKKVICKLHGEMYGYCSECIRLGTSEDSAVPLENSRKTGGAAFREPVDSAAPQPCQNCSELLTALRNTTQTLRLVMAGIPDYPVEARKEVRAEIDLADEIIRKVVRGETS